MLIRKKRSVSWRLWLGGIVAIIVISGAIYGGQRYMQMNNAKKVAATTIAQFPRIDSSTLTLTQVKILATLRAEYAAQPPGTKYSQGASEPWCADFVSWVMKEADTPLSNPNSGSWRIPGTMTLRDYFKEQGRWHAYGDNYSPKTGDIAIYDGNGPNGQHTNFVLQYENGILTTIGGNENGRIRIQRYKLADPLKLIGFGSLPA